MFKVTQVKSHREVSAPLLAEAHGLAAEVVRDAEVAANDAAAVRIEAQAKAGELLRELRSVAIANAPVGPARSGCRRLRHRRPPSVSLA